MWFYGGASAVKMAVVCGALLAAAHPQLGQRIQDESSISAEVLECLAHFLRTTHANSVLLVHNDLADVTPYMASIDSPLTIFNMGPLAIKAEPYILFRPPAASIIEKPYGLTVLLVAAEQEIFLHNGFQMSNRHRRAETRYLAVCLEPRFGALARGILDLYNAYGLYNIAVMTANDKRVHARYPPGGAYCNKPWPTEELGQCQGLSLNQLYEHKQPMHYAGCNPFLIVDVPPPCVLDNASLSEQPLVAGHEVALANIITRRLNMTRRVKAGHSGMSCSSSYAYHTDTIRWYVPVAGPRAQWKGVVLVFQAPLWAALLVFFLVNALAWWLVGAGAASYVECVLGSPLRFLVVSWMLCALVLVAAYQSQLLSTLLTPVAADQPITNEEQLLASDMPVDTDPIGKTLNTLRNSSQIYDHKQKFRVDADKPRAVLQYDLMAKYRAREQSDTRGKPTWYAFKEPATHLLLCVKLGTFTPLVVPVNRLMRRLMESGIVAKFMRDVDLTGSVTADGHENEPLNMGHLDFAFLVLLLGLALATLAFLMEKTPGWWRSVRTWLRSRIASIQNWWRTTGNARVRRWRRALHTRAPARINN